MSSRPTDNRLDALLFDVDGTLADTEEIHRRAFNHAFSAAGLDWEWSRHTYGQLLAVTGGKERIRHFIERYGAAVPQTANLDAWIAAMHQAKTDEYTRIPAEEPVTLRPGVRRLLEEARTAGLRLAIATTTSPGNVTALLEHGLGADSLTWFEVIGAGSVVASKKPARDIFDYVLEQLALSPDRCLAIEDSENGLRAALAAGIPTLVTLNQWTCDHDFTGAELVINHLGEPDQPFTVQAGDPGDSSYVDISLLQRLHRHAEGYAGADCSSTGPGT